MSEFDAIVVGAGPAGTSAAITLSRAGLNVALLERGSYPGSKNLFGGVLYTDVLEHIIPDFREKGAPLERYVAKKCLSVLSDRGELGISFQAPSWNEHPHNHSYTVLRSRFDRWYATQAEAEGVTLVTDVVVDRTLKDRDGSVVGVQVRMPKDEDAVLGHLTAPAVIVADGANSLLAEAEGMRLAIEGNHMMVGVREVLALPREKIEDRFNIEQDQGVAWEFIGEATGGLPGAGFIYTNRETLSVGVIAFIADLAAMKTNPAELLARFKAHPAVAPKLRGAELVEYGAHMIPETGYDRLGLMYKDGLLLAGDAAGLVNTSPQHQGTNYAMASGVMAAETVLEAHSKSCYSAAVFSGYHKRLAESFVLKDLEHFRSWPAFLQNNQHVFSAWPEAIVSMIEEISRVGGTAWSEREDKVQQTFRNKIGVLPFARTAFELRNALRVFGYGKAEKIFSLAGDWWSVLRASREVM